MSKNSRRKTKAPQIVTTVLLVACPLIMAEQAQAQTKNLTSFGLLAPSASQPQGLLQIGTTNQSPLQLGMNPNQFLGRFPFASPLSFIKATTPEEYKQQVQAATIALNSAKSALQTAIANQKTAQNALQQAKTALDSANSALQDAISAKSEHADDLATAVANKASAQTAYDQANSAFVTADDILTTKTTAVATALANLTNAQNQSSSASSNLTTANQALASAQSSLSTAQSNEQTAQSNQQLAQQTYDQAVTAYNNAKALVNQPTYSIQPTTYQIPDANFQTGEPWIGDGSGQSGQPEVHPGHIHFSYVGTEVYQDILISPRIIANYNFTVAVWNQDQNTTGYTGQTPDTYGLRIYFYDANNNLIHQNSLTSSTVHTWQDVTLQGNTDTTTEVAMVRIGVYGIDNGFWAGTYGPAANNVRLTLGWATANPAPTSTATMSVDIGENNWGTFTAPAGSVFVGSNLRYEAYNDPSCGANITPQNLIGSNSIYLIANNATWGDPCGGYGKHIVGTLTYTTQVEVEPDPSYASAVSSASALLATANSELTSAQQVVASAQQAVASAQQAVASASSSVSGAQQSVTSAQASYDTALAEQTSASSAKDSASASLASAQTSLTSATSALDSATATDASLATKQSDAESAKTIAESSYATAESSLSSAEQAVIDAEALVESSQEALDNIPLPEEPKPEPTPTPTPTASPEPKPEEPEEEKEIVVLPPLDDLTKVDFTEITPTDLTPAQAEEIKEAALATFETAEQGSPAYEAALDALLVAAQADDIVVDEALASIPGVGAAAVAVAEVLNLLSNVGADISPQVRETAQEATVAAVIVGQVAQAAMAATATSATGRVGK